VDDGVQVVAVQLPQPAFGFSGLHLGISPPCCQVALAAAFQQLACAAEVMLLYLVPEIHSRNASAKAMHPEHEALS